MILWKNGIFHTMESETSTKHQMITDQGIIIGFDDDFSLTQVFQTIDLNGAHVYPGFVDAHLHLLGYGQKLSRPNIFLWKGRTEILNAIKKSYQHAPLFIEGYHDCGLEAKDLDQISTEYPIYLRHTDYHSLTVNTRALSISGMHHSNGMLTEKEAFHVMQFFPKHSNKKLEELLQEAISSLYAYGVTSGHSDDLYYFNGFKDTLQVFKNVLKKYPFRTNLLIHHMVLKDYLDAHLPFLDQDDYLQLGAIKVFYDGTISSKTALLKSPYRHTQNLGMKVQSDHEWIQMIQQVRKYHLPLAIHVIGDQGLSDVLSILKKYPPKDGLHDRLIHTPYMDQTILDQMRKMPVSLDIQPQFLSSDLPWALEYMSKTPELVFPWKSLLQEGIHLAGSSDAPVEIPNPLLGIQSAVERQSDHDGHIYGEKEKLSRFEAISLYTDGANYSTMKDNRGFLKKGYICDLSIFKNDLLSIPSSQLNQEQCIMTVVDGQIVFNRLTSISHD
jgi:predicted amidohydrolase YtcJ